METVLIDAEQARQVSVEPTAKPERALMKGNEAIAEGAIRGGCEAYFGYPITPQSEILEYMSWRMPELGRVFLQAESEVASINMVYGAAAAGFRVMTSSSGPGISLMQEGLSFIAAAELPAVIVNAMRAGPGLGGILPGQADYFQATKGGGHGDYRLIVLAPNSVQEAMDLTAEAFELADKYRNPVMILTDGLIGQMMEPVELKQSIPRVPAKPWALKGCVGRDKNFIRTLYLMPEPLEAHNRKLEDKYRAITANELRYQEYLLDDADIVVVAYGTSSRVAQTAVRLARGQGIKAGLLRPITLYPFPHRRLRELAQRVRAVLVVEMSLGQMLEDVERAVCERAPVRLYSRLGGSVPVASEVLGVINEMVGRSME